MIIRLTVGPIQANCYIVGCKKTGEAVVIDPGGDVSRIVSEIVKKKFTVRYILNTHGHWDHTAGNDELKEITKAPLLIHRADAGGLHERPEGLLEEGQEILFGTWTLRVLHTPGHTPGGVSFFSPGVVFTGDTLFAGSIGRTDLPGGNYTALIQGVRHKLLSLDERVRVYPGHGPPSTIAEEKQYNPFFQ
jgi:glyoxylase-like metal-dependent hydrolase (beta-lactamase superfamily II)